MRSTASSSDLTMPRMSPSGASGRRGSRRPWAARRSSDGRAGGSCRQSLSGGGGRENVRSTASASILTRRGWAGVERRGCVRLERRPSAVGDGARVRNTCARLPVAKGGKPVSDGCRYWRSLPRRWGDRQLVRSLRRQVSTRSGRPMSGTSAGGSKAYVGASSRGRRDCARFVRTARCRRSVAKGGAGVAGR